MHEPYFLAIQSTYQGVECALFSGTNCLKIKTVDKFQATEQTILLIKTLLTELDLTLKQLAFIAVNQGPAPFTTLRVVLSTVNGVSFATHIPLIGVDGLHAMILEYGTKHAKTIALLNAFSNDVYYAISCPHNDIQSGYANIDALLENLCGRPLTGPLYFIGNGTKLYENNIKMKCANNTILETKNTLFTSIQQIGKMALKQWNQQRESIYKLSPLYLKQ